LTVPSVREMQITKVELKIPCGERVRNGEESISYTAIPYRKTSFPLGLVRNVTFQVIVSRPPYLSFYHSPTLYFLHSLLFKI
jgi:hypothetical protein